MGRKKRSNDAGGPPPPPLPPPSMMMAYPPPPSMMPPSILRHNDSGPDGGPPVLKRSRSSQQQEHTNNDDDAGVLENGERQSYPVKKYRPDSYYRSIEAFARYTKTHRMLDATYVRWTTGGGATLDRPIVFGIRIAGSMLSWGRGKTRDAAIDAAIRAAFVLVAAHGYDDFTLTEDCFTEEPYNVVSIPPPPPPPPPPGFGGMMMGMGGGMPPSLLPPPPPGMPPFFSGSGQVPSHHFGMMPPPSSSFNDEAMIPQPVAPSANLAVASTVASSVDVNGGNLVTSMKVGLSGTLSSVLTAGATAATAANNGLVFPGVAVDENGDEMSMEEIRMRLPRFQLR